MLGASIVALASTMASPAWAQCSPDPTQANTTTTCSGTDPNGLRVTTTGTVVQVTASATVQGSGAPAITVDIPAADTYYARSATINVSGRVDGGAQAGVSILSGASNGYTYYGTRSTVTVTAGATVTGANGIVVGPSSGNSYGQAIAMVDNAGTITGTSGIALLSANNALAGFASITNRSGGLIGAINGPVGTLTNAGMIDGGSRSAIDQGTTYNTNASTGLLTNSGSIIANSDASTVANFGYGQTATNSGTITNNGSGAAISGTYFTVNNLAGGRISSAGATAISATSYLALTNNGRIDGNVVSSSQNSYSGSTIDSTAGTINGSVTLGSGNDVLLARYTGSSALDAGITGAIDGGSGTDTVRIRVDTDTTVNTPVTLFTNFERLSIATAAGATTTLDTGFSSPSTLQVVGSGTLDNRGLIEAADQALVADDYSSSPRISNEGTIRTTSASSGLYAVSLSSAYSFDNSGTISAAGNGVFSSTQGSFGNSGTITSAGTGVSLFGPTFSNSGTIRSTGGTGLILTGSTGATDVRTNSGLIDGATVGANLSVNLVNTGTITSGGTGVVLQSYGQIDNRAGAVIGGGTTAIGFTPGASNYVFNAAVLNAGTINGNVNLQSSYQTSYGTGNMFFALPGGVLNGNLALGSGDYLVTQLPNTGNGQFAGINGTVTANNSFLHYQVRSDTTAVYAPVAGFQSIGFDLFDKANLTLTSNGMTAPPVTFAGVGAVDLTADIATATSPAIQTTGLLTPDGYSGTSNALSITSHGTLTLVHSDQNTYPGAAVSIGSQDSFTNAGTITAREQVANPYSPIAAIAGGNVTNSGTINLSGAIGIRGATALTNSGSILQVAGGTTAIGVQDVATVVNSGTINVGGVAVATSNYGYQPVTLTNMAGGTIASTGGTAVRVYGGVFTNAGTVTGTVDLGYQTPYYSGGPTRSYASSTYVAAGGTVTGDLLFGDGSDLFLQTGASAGVSGIIDGGGGTDIFGRSFSASGTMALDGFAGRNFEAALVQAIGSDTAVTITDASPFAGDLYAVGDGSVINQAAITGSVNLEVPYVATAVFGTPDVAIASFTNAGSVDGSVFGTATTFINSGQIGTAALGGSAVELYDSTPLSFTNSGQITGQSSAYGFDAVELFGVDAVSFANSGSITGDARIGAAFDDTVAPGLLSVANTGTIGRTDGSGAGLTVGAFTGQASAGGTVAITNSGIIAGTSGTIATGMAVQLPQDESPISFTIANSGTISAGAYVGGGTPRAAYGLLVEGGAGASGTISNDSTGTITATGDNAYALIVADTALSLDNAGTITATGGRVSTAIQTFDAFADSIRNTGTINGTVSLADGNDVVDNRGTINGRVLLGAGDDRFTQGPGGVVNGVVDGGDGTDAFVIDSTGNTTLAAGQLVNFERLTQVGTGTVNYTGVFGVDTIDLQSGTLAVAAGQTLVTAGSNTVTGGSAGVTVANAGTIAGGVLLGDGGDTVINAGAIGGAVRLGAGDDSYTEGLGSRVAGGVDGGAGTDLYRVVLAGDRAGIGARSNFERLAVDGTGTLALTLDQNFQSVALNGTNLSLTLGGFTVGRIDGSDGTERVALDGDVADIALGGGDDTLTLGRSLATGHYDGGTGNDALRFTAAGPVTLSGNATGFETVSLTGNALVVTGTLGSAGGSAAFGDGSQSLTVARGGTLAGTIDLGSGDDTFRLAAGGTVQGTVAGGAGIDIATIETPGNTTLAAGVLTGFELLTTEGAGTLTLAGGSFGFDRATVAGNITIAADASLVTPQLAFGAGDNRLIINGGFTGSVDGGAGTDGIDVAGGSAAAPVAFGSIANVEALRMSAGYASIARTASFNSIALGGGRLVGLAGSTITAPTITVGTGATFGSAGTVNGNITVAGTLSPGASPGTMTVNGNVALASGSTSLFEITPAVSDKLLINGGLSIASGATLQLVPTGAITPGTTLDLIVASGGITGNYTSVVKPASLFGFIVQDADRIRLFGEFLNDAGYSPQVQRSIDYLNGVLTSGRSSAALLAAVPSLVTGTGASNQALFARLTPEPYASARQIAVENGLTLADAGRSDGFAAHRDEPGFFTFASALGTERTLETDTARGVARAQTNGYGFLGGLGWGSGVWSLGGFVGYLDNHQHLADLGATTNADGVVAGVHARLASGGFSLQATGAYDGGDARTRRTVPNGSAEGRYDLHGWTVDVAADYAVPLGTGWAVRPGVGATAIRSTRDGTTETGNSPFALAVARDRDSAVFVDGSLTFSGDRQAGRAGIKPYLSLGARYQVQGRRPYALASLDGGDASFLAEGAARAPVVATATLGADVALSQRVALFGALTGESGDADHRAGVKAGLRLAF